MRIGIVTPAPAGSTYGNRVTAVRWARLLKKLGHRVLVRPAFQDEPLDLLVALHARRSYQSIRRFHIERPERPILVALTGTDVYHDLERSKTAGQALALATRIVVLQPKALEQIPVEYRAKAQVIYQSAEPPRGNLRKTTVGATFDVSVIGHLRLVKDPFRAALAARLLTVPSRIRILQIGRAMTEAMAKRAQAEARRNPRYKWLGEQTHRQVQRWLAKSRLLVLSSRLEGGANVLSEAAVAGVPVLASRIDGNVGILGEDYPGLFDVADARGLATLLQRAESEAAFLADLRRRIKELRPLFSPLREQRAWAQLIQELPIKG